MSQDGPDIWSYSVFFFPGDFFLFWNVLVPLSVYFNVTYYGLRPHEMGLFVALLLNPFVLERLFGIYEPYVSWIVAIFLIVWIIKVLHKWHGYNHYCWKFWKSLLLLICFIVAPSMAYRYLWSPLSDALYKVLKAVLPSAPCEVVSQVQGLAMLVLAVVLLLHSFWFYTQKTKPPPCKKPDPQGLFYEC